MSYCYGVGGVTEVSSGSGPSVRMVRIVHHELDARCWHGPPKGGGRIFFLKWERRAVKRREGGTAVVLAKCASAP